MSEMTPDPVLDKLSRFTPRSEAVDASRLLFAAGRASARTPWGWKVVVAGLLVSNSICVGFLVFRPHNLEVNIPPPEPASPIPRQNEPTRPDTAPSSEDPWTYRALMLLGDPDKFPRSAASTNQSRPSHSMSVLSSRDGELD